MVAAKSVAGIEAIPISAAESPATVAATPPVAVVAAIASPVSAAISAIATESAAVRTQSGTVTAAYSVAPTIPAIAAIESHAPTRLSRRGSTDYRHDAGQNCDHQKLFHGIALLVRPGGGFIATDWTLIVVVVWVLFPLALTKEMNNATAGPNPK